MELLFPFLPGITGIALTLYFPVYLVLFILRKIKVRHTCVKAGPSYLTLCLYLAVISVIFPGFRFFELIELDWVGPAIQAVIIPLLIWRGYLDGKRYKAVLAAGKSETV